MKKDNFYCKENNAIYYDQNYVYERNNEIYNDAEEFKVKVSGTFVFVTNLKALRLVLEQIDDYSSGKNEYSFKFDLICTGSASHDVFSFLNENYNLKKYIKRACIYTMSYDRYKEKMNQFPLIKGVYTRKHQVLDFLDEGEGSSRMFRIDTLLTLEDYETNFVHLHKEISKHYGNTSYSSYIEALRVAKKFLDNTGGYNLCIKTYGDKKAAMLEVLKLFEDVESNYEKIIENYTKEYDSFHQDFNYILDSLYIEGAMSFGWFIANTMYSLDKYAEKSGKGLKTSMMLYRGRYMGIIDLLNFERYKNKILFLPTFTSTSCKESVAFIFL